jgi:hypothetical protein
MEIQTNQSYSPTEAETRTSKLFTNLDCPYCCSPISRLEDLIVNELTGLSECPMCIEIRIASEGEYRR